MRLEVIVIELVIHCVQRPQLLRPFIRQEDRPGNVIEVLLLLLLGLLLIRQISGNGEFRMIINLAMAHRQRPRPEIISRCWLGPGIRVIMSRTHQCRI